MRRERRERRKRWCIHIGRREGREKWGVRRVAGMRERTGGRMKFEEGREGKGAEDRIALYELGRFIFRELTSLRLEKNR